MTKALMLVMIMLIVEYFLKENKKNTAKYEMSNVGDVLESKGIVTKGKD